MVGAGAGGFAALMAGAPKAAGAGSSMMSKFGKAAGGMVGGFGQGLMDQNMRRTYGTARSGGYHDLMENQQINRFVNAEPGKVNSTKAKIQELLSDPALSHLFEGRI